MQYIYLRKYNVEVIFLSFLICLQTACTSSKALRFVLSDNYTRERFSGRDIGGHTIGLCPLLTKDGPITGDSGLSAVVAETVVKMRPDLVVINADSVHAVLSGRLPPDLLQRYYNLLFTGEILLLQTLDSLWNALNSDYLLLIRMRHGMYVRTFGNKTLKRIGLEAELWDRRAMETVWRINITGTCTSGKVSDGEFLVKAIEKISEALPLSAPAYESGSW